MKQIDSQSIYLICSINCLLLESTDLQDLCCWFVEARTFKNLNLMRSSLELPCS